MSDTEKEKFRQIGIDLINEYRQQRGFGPIDYLAIDTPEVSAFIRSIQLHEKTKQELADCKQEFDDFRQLVSDTVHHYIHVDGGPDDWGKLAALIILAPKPDPLVDVANSLGFYNTAAKHWVSDVRAELDAAGFEIREKGQ